MILLIDNYDSFSYNLYQMVGEIVSGAGSVAASSAGQDSRAAHASTLLTDGSRQDAALKVIRNDAMTVDEIRALHPSHIIISPGPGRPADAGICEELVRQLRTEFPILGVCLGEQAICEAYGATIGYAKKLMHGKQSIASLDLSSPVFAGLPETIPVARYHSLAVERDTIPSSLKVIATADDGEVMGVQDTQYPVYGLQFHPESIMTPDGEKILRNFISGQHTTISE